MEGLTGRGPPVTVVIDASAAACWCFSDEASPQSDALFAEVASKGAVVPGLWHLEIGNILRQAERRKRISEEVSQRQLALLARLPIRIDDETARHAWLTTIGLARNHTLTVYDAAYLDLALRQSFPLASKDDALLRAAETCGVAVIPL